MPDRREAILVALIALVFLLPFSGARDLWNPNEPIYGHAVQEMVEGGEWLTPTVGGEPFYEKPILYYWLARLAVMLFGLTEFALRIPLVVLAALSASVVYLFAFRLAGRRRARWSVAIFLTTYMVWWTGTAVQMDSMVLAFVLFTVYFAREAFEERGGWLLPGLCAGLGFLAKGPVVWILVTGIVLVERLLEGRLGRALRAPWWRALPVALLVGASWYILLAANGQVEGIVESFYRQNFERFSNAWDHSQPWHYYLKYFWIDMMPWAWLVPVALFRPRQQEGSNALDRMAWVFLVVVIGFFSLSESKRSPYIMPIAPAVAWLASGVVLGWIDGTLTRGRKKAVLAATSFGTMLLVLLGLYAIVKGVDRFPAFQSVLWPLTVVGILGLAGWIWALPAKNRSALPVVWTVTWAMLWLYFAAILLPAVDPLKSARGAALQIEREIPAEVPLAGYRWWIWRSGVRFYSGREIGWLPDAETAADWWSESGARCLAVPERHREEATSRLGLKTERFSYSIGSRQSFVYCRDVSLEPGVEEAPGLEAHEPADQ